jgi:hypothetical protein
MASKQRNSGYSGLISKKPVTKFASQKIQKSKIYFQDGKIAGMS